MGIYLNPPDAGDEIDKRRIVLKNAQLVSRAEYRAHKPGERDVYGVCIIDNGDFYAAGVAFDEGERDAHADDVSGREKEFALLTLDEIERMDERAARQLRRIAERER